MNTAQAAASLITLEAAQQLSFATPHAQNYDSEDLQLLASQCFLTMFLLLRVPKTNDHASKISNTLLTFQRGGFFRGYALRVRRFRE